MSFENLSPEERKALYIETLSRGLAAEHPAISWPLVAIALAPPDDIPILAEILQDENDHWVKWSGLLTKAQGGSNIIAEKMPVD